MNYITHRNLCSAHRQRHAAYTIGLIERRSQSMYLRMCSAITTFPCALLHAIRGRTTHKLIDHLHSPARTGVAAGWLSMNARSFRLRAAGHTAVRLLFSANTAGASFRFLIFYFHFSRVGCDNCVFSFTWW